MHKDVSHWVKRKEKITKRSPRVWTILLRNVAIKIKSRDNMVGKGILLLEKLEHVCTQGKNRKRRKRTVSTKCEYYCIFLKQLMDS